MTTITAGRPASTTAISPNAAAFKKFFTVIFKIAVTIRIIAGNHRLALIQQRRSYIPGSVASPIWNSDASAMANLDKSEPLSG